MKGVIHLNKWEQLYTNHGNLLYKKSNNDENLKFAWSCYEEYRLEIDELEIVNQENIRKLVQATNIYREKVINIFEKRKNSGQEGFRSTILEEFFCHLFKDLIKSSIKDSPAIYFGKGNSYVSLGFSPKTLGDLFENPKPYIHTKDQDFIIGCAIDVEITLKDNNQCNTKESTVIPVLAIECKTYIERNMLDSCAATATRLKNAMPYCMYILASEYMKMDDAFPELTDIDEVFILCKASNSEREQLRKEDKPPHLLDEDLVVELFEMVKKHFNKRWWNPEDALRSGRVINRP
ncbi:hypothetical protein CN391_18215 [Bacillus anthracis]|nr:hypothetical protein CN391_18215 [Bacillus anthracis]